MTVETMQCKDSLINERENEKLIKEVIIYESGNAVLKVESGTTLKVLKLLYKSGSDANTEILGVRPKNPSGGIPCIITLDDSKLSDISYDILISDNKSNSKNDENEINRCVECSRESWKTKSFAHIGMNTELSVNPSSSKEKLAIINQDQVEQTEDKQLNSTSKSINSPTPDHDVGTSFIQQKEYLLMKNQNTKVDTQSPKGRSPPPPPHDDFLLLNSHRHHERMRYPIIETSAMHCEQPPMHYDRIVRTWMMEKPHYERRSTACRNEQFSPQNNGRSPHPHQRSRSPLSPHDLKARHRLLDYPPSHYHGGVYDKYRPVLLPTYPHDRNLHSRREENTYYGEEGKDRVAAQIKDYPHRDHGQMVDIHHHPLHDKTHRGHTHSGEQPPVFVLPNDYDVVSGIDPRVVSIPEKRPVKYSPPPSSVKEREGENQIQTEKSGEKSPQQQRGIKDEFQNSPPNTGGSSNGGDSPDSSTTPTTTNTSQKLSCKICSSVFPTKSLLYKHLRGHTSDEKPFKCNECGQGFTLSSNLRQHRIIHRGYKPFQCEFCGKKFMRSNVYKQHRRIHTGEEMHKCGLCPSEFLQKYALLKHMKKNHNIDAIDN